jgi:hypothetical protein
MSFRQFGGLQFASKHNAVASYYNTSSNLLVTQNVGQSNSYINFLSDISGNQIFGNVDVSGNLRVSGDIDSSGNLTASKIYLTAPFHSYASNEVVPKSYVDTVGSGLIPYGRVKAISTYDSRANNTTYPVPIGTPVSNPFLIDGVSIDVGNNVLLNDQGSNSGQDPNVNNGVYTLNSSRIFERSTTIFPSGSDSKAAYISVVEGTANSLSGWVQTNDDPPNTVGTTPLIFSNFFSFAFKLGQGLYPTQQNEQIYINVDPSLNFIQYLDNSGNTLNIGNYTNIVNIGKVSAGNNKISVTQNGVGINNNNPQYALDVSGNLRTTLDASINSITVGLGGGNVADNTATGYQALKANTTGTSNVASGYQALYTNSTGTSNVASGFQALYTNSTGTSNVATGYEALYFNTTGTSNVASGYQALLYNSTGSSNVAIGADSLYFNTIGQANTAIGRQALLNNRTGYDNVAMGNNAGIDLSGNSYRNTFLGTSTNVSLSSLVYNNSTALGYQAIITASNQIVLGTSNESVYIPGSYLGIGGVYNPSPGFALDINGNLRMNNMNTIYGTNTSGSQEVFLAPRWSDNASYLNYGTGGFYIRNNISTPTMFMDDNNKVGIGTITPAYQLSLGISNADCKLALFDDGTGNNWFGIGANDNKLTFGAGLASGGSPQMVLNNTGCVVLTGSLGNAINPPDSLNFDNLILRSTKTPSVPNSPYSMGFGVDFGTGYGYINAAGNGGVQPILINPRGGNVGIGIGTTPAYTLDVSGNTNVKGISLFTQLSQYTTPQDICNNAPIQINNISDSNIDDKLILTAGATNNTAGTIQYMWDGGNTFSSNIGNHLQLNPYGGCVFINKLSSPDFYSNNYALDVGGNVNITSAESQLTIKSSSDQSGFILADGITNQLTTSNFGIMKTGQVQAGSKIPFVITNTGNVCINYTNLSWSTAYALDVGGSVNATSYNTPSDYRIKENVTQLDSKFVVDNLNPVTYLNTKSDKQDIGLIAHELQEIYPELVNGEKDGEEFQSVNYIGLIPILIKEIQELKKEIKSVKIELNELKNK